MQINFTGQNIDVTSALKSLVEKKFERIEKHFVGNHISSVKVTFNVHKLENIAEIDIHIKGTDLHAKASSEDMYKTVDLLMAKIDRQAIKYKEKHNNHHEGQ